jgi:hypothetical protein
MESCAFAVCLTPYEEVRSNAAQAPVFRSTDGVIAIIGVIQMASPKGFG